MKMLFLTNDWRAQYLAGELRKRVSGFYKIEFDPIAPFYRYLAAMLTFHPDKRVWWNIYQWHALVQKGRRQRVLRFVKENHVDFDMILMYSSWFDPVSETAFENIPFYYYIDQSCNKKADDYDVVCSPALDKPRQEFNRRQFKSYLRCKKIFCFSRWARKQTLESHNLPEEKVIDVGWGPTGVNCLDEKIEIKDISQPTVLFVGNEFYRKGADVLRKAIPAVVEKFPNTRFKIVGKNTDKAFIEPHPHLEMLGAISDKTIMKKLFKEASVFVLPHRFDRSPHVLVEAMSAGLPIITSNQGGAIEVVRHNENGFIIEMGAHEALASYLIELLSDKDKIERFSQKSKEIVASGYTWDKVAEKIMINIEKEIQ